MPSPTPTNAAMLKRTTAEVRKLPEASLQVCTADSEVKVDVAAIPESQACQLTVNSIYKYQTVVS